MLINKETEQYRLASNEVSLRKLFDALDLVPTPMQLAIIKLMDEELPDWSELNLIAARRSGKSLTMATIVILDLLKPNSSVILVSKSAKSLAAIFNEIIKFLRLLQIPIDKLSSQQYTLTVNGNSHLKCSVHKQTSNLLGNRASLLLLDECGVYQFSDFMETNLEPMRLDYGTYDTKQFVSKTIRVSSPRTIGSDFHIVTEKGLAPLKDRYKFTKNDGSIHNGCVTLNYSIYDNPMLTADLVEAIRLKTKPDVWKTEYLGEFIHQSATNAFPAFDKELCTFNVDKLFAKISSMDNNETIFPIFQGMDVGLADSTAIIYGTLIENTMYIFDMYSSNYVTTKEIAEAIHKIDKRWLEDGRLKFDIEALYIDPSAALTRFDLANDYEIENLPAFNKIKIGIDSINSLFKSGNLMIADNLTTLISQIETLAFKDSITESISSTGSRDPFVRVKGHHFDMAHAFRYLVASVKRYWSLPEDTTPLKR